MASGTPSRRLQSLITQARLASVTAKPGTAAAAHWANSSTASPSPAVRARGSGTGSGGIARACSPGTASGCLLVASTVTRVARSKMSASMAHASIRCSQVSRISSSRWSRRCSRIASSREWFSFPASPRPVATVSGSSSGSCSPDSSTSHAPSGNSAASPVPADWGWADWGGPTGPGELGHRAQRDAGLPHPAGSGDGHQPGGAQQAGQLGQLASASDEAGDFEGQLTGALPG